jgi:hypothetical protein
MSTATGGYRNLDFLNAVCTPYPPLRAEELLAAVVAALSAAPRQSLGFGLGPARGADRDLVRAWLCARAARVGAIDAARTLLLRRAMRGRGVGVGMSAREARGDARAMSAAASATAWCARAERSERRGGMGR